MTVQLLPTLPGCSRGIVGKDENGWTVQCECCGKTAGPDPSIFNLIRFAGFNFNGDPIPPTCWGNEYGPAVPIRRCPQCRDASIHTRLGEEDR